MSVIATAVKHLLAAGVTGDALLAAIAEMEAQVRSEPKPKSAGAQRQARYEERKRQKASEMTQSDENDASDASDGEASLPLPPNEKNSNPPTPTHPEGKTPRTRKAREEVPLPGGWEPVLTEAAQRIVDGWPPGMIERERMAFEAHAAANGRETKDWQAAFRTWIAKADRQRTENGSRGNNGGRTARPYQHDRRDGFERACDAELGLPLN